MKIPQKWMFGDLVVRTKKKSSCYFFSEVSKFCQAPYKLQSECKKRDLFFEKVFVVKQLNLFEDDF